MPDIKLIIYATSVPAILTGGGVVASLFSGLSTEYKSIGQNLIFWGTLVFIIEIAAYVFISMYESNERNRY